MRKLTVRVDLIHALLHSVILAKLKVEINSSDSYTVFFSTFQFIWDLEHLLSANFFAKVLTKNRTFYPQTSLYSTGISLPAIGRY